MTKIQKENEEKPLHQFLNNENVLYMQKIIIIINFFSSFFFK